MFSNTAISGVAVRTGLRQSMPSSSMDNCARVSATLPSSAFGQTNRPRSRRLANKPSPSPPAVTFRRDMVVICRDERLPADVGSYAPCQHLTDLLYDCSSGRVRKAPCPRSIAKIFDSCIGLASNARSRLVTG
ncbi:MAG TPA: hypothetical protein VG675_25175 [Bryobacteraceae bacterium]|nr:hypothetical protein [Bryobacteraceae bacterium]